MQVAVGNGSVVFVLSKPAFQTDSLIVVRTVGNSIQQSPSRFCGLFLNGAQQCDC